MGVARSPQVPRFPQGPDRRPHAPVALGATRVDIGQGNVDRVVMADPDSNEFCVLRPASSRRPPSS